MRVLLICNPEFNPDELWTALKVLDREGHDFDVASTSRVIRNEATRKPAAINRLVYQIQPTEEDCSQYDGLMLTSGNSRKTKRIWSDRHILKLVDYFDSLERPMGAICMMVPTLRNVLKGVSVSVFPMHTARELLEDSGAILSGTMLTVDGRFVTGEAPFMAEMWAEEFVRVLRGLPPLYAFSTDPLFVRKTSPRYPPKAVRAVLTEYKDK